MDVVALNKFMMNPPKQIKSPKLSDPSLKIANPKVFFDMTVDRKPVGRIVMELFADTTPRTAEKFRVLCTGEKGMGKLGKPLHYRGSIFHHVDPDFLYYGGDITAGNGSGVRSTAIDSSRMRTSSGSSAVQVPCSWLTVVQTLTDLSS